MDELAVGIVNHFTQQYQSAYHDFYNDISGKLYAAGNVPSGTTGPYATFGFPVMVLDNQEVGEKGKDEFIMVEFQLWSETFSKVEVGDMYTKLKSWFDDCEVVKGNWAALSVSGYTVVTVDRGTTIEIPYDAEDSNQRYVVDYMVHLQKD